ncbi:MAG: hypothetical protein A2X86_13815 [Bdellovibrionales bacterium GWA2_49_15]|nr:MAG: hypothetical protein A2X86_13815 [Bdellovibrionales bacterium GWA2_49_15]
MKLAELRPWRSSLTPGSAWPFTSNIPQDVLGVDQGVNDLMRTFAGDRDFTISYCNDFRAYPAIDVRESTDGYSLDADIPGISENELELELHNNILSIKGAKTRETCSPKDNYDRYIHHERCHGSFCREIAFEKEVNMDLIYADFKNGVLHVELVKAQQLTS